MPSGIDPVGSQTFTNWAIEVSCRHIHQSPYICQILSRLGRLGDFRAR